MGHGGIACSFRPLAERQEAIARLAAEIALAPPAASGSGSKKAQAVEALLSASVNYGAGGRGARNDAVAAAEHRHTANQARRPR